ncbi:unnamed protein product [Rotaria socialis]|uniref:CHHC U11-48K-type domain-containing protein n=1 Tax=Rotaria socialis TaxID=392032 RepID=A0A817ZJ71_9BILA|nr:unnamed protein product [Rotaria socialis]CAF3395531.1 unnamed protein product [Rotaria socialis]CAF3564988.1 unnamed protein product [Rotaria socialis]CAF3686463.1 unnamed protein product [Rotaria socialis]
MSSLYLCPDDFWRCPIDLNHQVLAKRFQYHIRRCTIANPHIRRVRCVFNANHLTTPNDLLSHMSTCPDAIDRSTVLIGLSDDSPSQPWIDNCRRSSAPTDWKMFNDVTVTEDWDDDIRERREKTAAVKEQSTSAQSSSSPSHTPYLHAKQHKDIENDSCQLQPVEETSQLIIKNSFNTALSVSKQAHAFKEHANDGLIHPVETDELTKNLMKIRTLQLIGGAGRGTCCLFRKGPPVFGSSLRKSP